jgi:hypothetical protein
MTNQGLIRPNDKALTHGCVRCRAQISLTEGMCANCNPLGLKGPAASQAHGTILIGIIIGVIALFLAAHFSIAGTGPFAGSITGVRSDPGGLAVTLTVSNSGTANGATACRIYDPTIPGIGPESSYVGTPKISPGQTSTFTVAVGSLGTVARPLAVSCANP